MPLGRSAWIPRAAHVARTAAPLCSSKCQRPAIMRASSACGGGVPEGGFVSSRIRAATPASFKPRPTIIGAGWSDHGPLMFARRFPKPGSDPLSAAFSSSGVSGSWHRSPASTMSSPKRPMLSSQLAITPFAV